MQDRMRRYFPVFVLPTMAAYSAAFLIPFLLGIFLSFTEFRTVVDAKWVGLSNFNKVFISRDFLNALWFTVRFAAISVTTINLFGFLMALLLTGQFKGRNIFRAVFFMPNLIGGIILGYIWLLILNGILYRFDVTITFKPEYGFWGLVILMNWQLIGYMMVIYIAGIQNIPHEVRESAKIDGAGPFQILTKITIPLAWPSFTICMFLTMTNAFKLFDQNLALTAGAPSKQTQLLALDIYNTFYGSVGNEGVGQAKAVVFFIIVSLIAFIQLRVTRSREVEI